MHRVLTGFLAAAALLAASTGAALAAPSDKANCLAEVATSFSPGSLGRELSVQAKGTGLGWIAGGNGEGLGPTDPPDCA